MPQFQYRAIDKEGKRVKGVLESNDEKTLLDTLKTQGCTALEVLEIKASVGTAAVEASPSDMADSESSQSLRKTWNHLFGRKVSIEELAVATRQIATMLEAGITINEAFRIVISSAEKGSPIKDMFFEISRLVQQGKSLEKVLSRFPKVFSSHYVSLVAMGLNTGRLQETMSELSNDLEKEHALRKKIIASLTYPLFVFIFTFILNSIIFLYIFPQIINVLVELKVDLPFFTRVMVFLVGLMTNPLYVAAFFVALIIVIIQMQYYISTPIGKFNFDRFKLYIPVFGGINRVIFVERFCRTLSLLFKYGITIQDALLITSNVCANDFLKDSLFRVLINDIHEGTEIDDAMRAHRIIPPHVIHLVAAGVASGELTETLRQAGLLYEMELTNRLQRYVTLIEPIMIILMSTVIFLTVISIMLPLYQVIIRMGT
ncbi:MAG: type II secretion system F family protein [Vulcanimicrobiota bacterium]